MTSSWSTENFSAIRGGVEPSDILSAAEQNPFDVYRRRCGLEERSASALRHLGGAETAVSANSRKLRSLGVLLAAFERELGVPDVQPTGYVIWDAANCQRRDRVHISA